MFGVFANEEEEGIPRLPVIEVEIMEQIYELAPRDLWTYVVDTPLETFLDLDDEAREGNPNPVIRRLYKHSSDYCQYLEFD